MMVFRKHGGSACPLKAHASEEEGSSLAWQAIVTWDLGLPKTDNHVALCLTSFSLGATDPEPAGPANYILMNLHKAETSP